MGRNQLEIFATSADFAGILRAVEDQLAISFAVAGTFETDTVRRLSTSADVISAMTAPDERPSAFLAIDRTEKLNTRKIIQKRGAHATASIS